MGRWQAAFETMTGPQIYITLNGESRAVPLNTGLPSLLTDLGLPMQAVLIEHNGRALLRDEWPGLELVDGDRLEILRIVAGG